MANVERTVKVLFGGDDALSKVILSITKEFRAMDDVVQSVAQPLASLGEGVLKLEAGAVALGTALGTYAVTQSVKFQMASAELQKILGGEADKLGEAQTRARELGIAYGQSGEDVLRSATEFKRAGYDIDSALGLAKSAMDLVIAGNVEGAEATEILISTLKGFKAPATEAARLVDVLNIVSDNYATNVTELGTGMANLAPIAAKMGFNFEETAGILTPIIEIFRSGSEASNALRMGLLKLIDDSAPVVAGLDRLGISQEKLGGGLKSGKEILLEVAQAFRTVDEDSKLFFASQLVGNRQAAKMVEIFDGLAYTAEITGVALKGTGSAMEQVALIMSKADKQIDVFIARLKDMAITSGDKVLRSFQGVLGGMNEILAAMAKGLDAGVFDVFFDSVSGFGDDLAILLKGIAAAIPDALGAIDFDKLLKSFDNLYEAISHIFGDLDLTDAEDLADVFQIMVDSLGSLTNISAGIISFFTELFDYLRDSVSYAQGFGEQTELAFGKFLGSAIFVAKAGTAIAGAIMLIQESGLDLEAVLSRVVGGIQIAWNTLQALFDVGALAIVSTVSGLLSILDTITLGLIGSLGEMNASVIEIGAGIVEDLSQQGEDVAKGFNTLKSGMLDVVGTAREAANVAVETGKIIDKEIPEEKTTDWSLNIDALVLQESMGLIDDTIPKERTTDIIVKADENSLNSFENTMNKRFEEKLYYVGFDMDIDKVQEQTKRIEAMLEFKAKVDVANIERDMEIIKGIFDTVEASVESTGEALTELAGIMASTDLDMLTKWTIEEELRKESDRRDAIIELQRLVTEAQLRLIESRIDSIQKGDALIQVEGGSLEPYLRGLFMEILSQVQIMVSETYQDFLLGISGV